mgnify:CR=1 FL=1
MPNIKSAKKRVKVNSVKALNNQMAKSELKTTLKKFDAAIAGGDKAEATAAYDRCQGCRSGGCQAPPAQEQCVQQEEQDDYQAQRHGVSSGIEHRNRKFNLRFFFLHHLDIYRNVLTNAETVVY